MIIFSKAYYNHGGRQGSRGGSTKRQYGIGGQRLPKPDSFNPNSVTSFDYQAQVCGNVEYEIHGTNSKGEVQKIWADGIAPQPPQKPKKVIEVKYVGNATRSAYVPGSRCDERRRQEVMQSMKSEFERYSTVLNDPRNGLEEFEVVTNAPESKKLWEGLMQEYGIKGKVIIVPYNEDE